MKKRPILRGGKPFIAWSFIGTAILTAFLTGAAAQNYTRQNYRMTFFGCNATYANATATNPTAVTCQALFKRNYVNQADSSDTEEAGNLTVSLDLLASPNTHVVAGGADVTRAQLAALIRKAMEDAGGL